MNIIFLQKYILLFKQIFCGNADPEYDFTIRIIITVETFYRITILCFQIIMNIFICKNFCQDTPRTIEVSLDVSSKENVVHINYFLIVDSKINNSGRLTKPFKKVIPFVFLFIRIPGSQYLFC